MRKNIGFTLVEVLVAVALTGIILLTGYSTFQKIMQAQGRLGAMIDVQKNLFYTNEKMAALIRDGGTIDYEEYFNRRMIGYDQSKRTLDNIFTFTNFSHFGNGDNNMGRPNIYFCGVSGGTDGEGCITDKTPPGPVFLSTTMPFPNPANTNFITGQQAYGQYKALAYNYLDAAGYPMPIKLPPIFKTNEKIKIASRATNGTVSWVDKNITEVGLPELYLIKKNLDNSYVRTYFRHVYVQDPFTVGSITCNPTKTKIINPGDNIDGCLGKIQMTKLEGCDINSDGIVDAWKPLPDFAVGTVNCPTTDAEIYKSAHEEIITTGSIAANLKWVDVTSPDMNVVRATFLPNPLKIPALMSGSGDSAQSPSVSVYLEVQLSTKLRNKSFVRTDMNYPRTLITTYDLSE